MGRCVDAGRREGVGAGLEISDHGDFGTITTKRSKGRGEVNAYMRGGVNA